MLNSIKNSVEENKSRYLNKMHENLGTIQETMEADSIIQIFRRHFNLMREEKFDWIHESETENLNFGDIKGFLNDFISIFNKEIMRNFSMGGIFKDVFPLEYMFYYFKNLNMSFGNKVYDESLRFKTNLLKCFKELYLEADFRFNFKIQFDFRFDFDSTTRNALRAVNRAEILALYETSAFSLKQFIYYLMDKYYPRVGWRWIGASHHVYFLTLEIIVFLFELGFWTVEDQECLFLKLYEICEVMISLEKNSAKDSERLAEAFNNELISGFSNAREYITLIIIHSYQLLIDNNVEKNLLANLKFYYNLIITRYIFNSTKIKKSNLRKQNNLRQILYYLNSNNFDPIIDKSHRKDDLGLIDFEISSKLNGIMEDIIKDIKSKDINTIKNELLSKFLDAISVIVKNFKTKSINLETLLHSKVFKKMMPIIDLFKDQFKEEAEVVIDLSFCLLNRACLNFPNLLESHYLKSVMRDFFGIAPFKNLFIISKLVTENNLKINRYFIHYLGTIFKNVIKEMVKIYNKDEIEITSSHEIYISIIELFIQYFGHSNENQIDLEFVELKMSLAYSIQQHFLSQIDSIILENSMIMFRDDLINKTFVEIINESSEAIKLTALRTKEAYLMIKLYNLCFKDSFKNSQLLFEFKNIDKFIELLVPGTLLSTELINLINEAFILPVNNLIVDRLKYNKSKLFILMENSFPIADKESKSIFTLLSKILTINDHLDSEREKYEIYVLESVYPLVYKFFKAFIYLNDDLKVAPYEAPIEKVFHELYQSFKKLSFIKVTFEEMMDIITNAELNDDKSVYKMLKLTETSYTNYSKLKRQLINMLAFIEGIYKDRPNHQIHLSYFSREPYAQTSPRTKFDENLKDIISKIVYISSIDSKESMKNMLMYFIEEFERSSLEISLEDSKKTNSFIFLKQEYLDLLTMMKILFENNRDFKQMFIELIEGEQNPDEQKFFTIFWGFYRDSLFFSSYNFFHNNVWFYISTVFLELNGFFLETTKSLPNVPNTLLKYLTDFKLVTTFNNNHTLFFQLYVILECLGNYSKMLTLTKSIRLEHKQSIFFNIEQVLQLLSNLLVLPAAQEKIYIYRIDIWMNIVTTNVTDIHSSFYDLKDQMMNYFLAIAGGNNSTIVKFYGANVNPDFMKWSINELFVMELKELRLNGVLMDDPLRVHKTLEDSKIYRIVQKMYKFYSILVRHDVQTNYLNLFMKQKLENLNPKDLNFDSLLSQNLLYFYYVDKINDQVNFQIEAKDHATQTIDQRVRIFPELLSLVKEGKMKLVDYLNYLKDDQTDGQTKKVALRVSALLRLMESPDNATHEEKQVLEKVQSNDFDWIMSNIFA